MLINILKNLKLFITQLKQYLHVKSKNKAKQYLFENIIFQSENNNY